MQDLIFLVVMLFSVRSFKVEIGSSFVEIGTHQEILNRQCILVHLFYVCIRLLR